MSTLIYIPGQDKPTEKEIIRSKFIRALYEDNELVRTIADRIHSSGMLAPPACDSCIEGVLKSLTREQTDSLIIRVFPL